MTIDAGIYSQIRQPQQPDLIGMAGQFAQLQGAQQQNRLAQIKMDEYERGVQNQNRLRTLLAEGADAQGLVKAGFLKEGQDWAKNQAEVTDKGADTAKKRLELVTGKITQYRDYLSNVNDPQTAAQWLQAQYQDPDVGPIMSKFAPIDQAVQRIPQEPSAFQQWKQQQALGATKFVEMNKPTITTRNLGGTTDTLATEGLTGVTRTLNSAKNTQSPDNAASVGAQYAIAAANRDQAQATRDAARINTGFKNETELRKEFADLPEVKRYKSAYPSYKAIEDAAKTSNPQADINLIYGLAKLYDPESVVREGEYATIANSQAIPERIKSIAQSLIGNGKLTPETKKQILAEARNRIATFENEYGKAKAGYTEIAKARGIDTRGVFTDVGGAAPAPAPAAPAAPAGGNGWGIQKVN